MESRASLAARGYPISIQFSPPNAIARDAVANEPHTCNLLSMDSRSTQLGLQLENTKVTADADTILSPETQASLVLPPPHLSITHARPKRFQYLPPATSTAHDHDSAAWIATT